MARVIGILGSARKDGYTMRVLAALLNAASKAPGVQTECVQLLDYTFGPCRSCYTCIRQADHRCIQNDDMGGAGALWQKIEAAHAMVWASPVHRWTVDALIHLFIERLYPFIWSGELKGIPVATLAVASNQGFQIEAHRALCQLAFSVGAKYMGGLPVHAAYLGEALKDAAYLGERIAQAALEDEKGRRALTDEEMWLAYQNTPWAVYPHYVANLTMGTANPELSIIKRALAQGAFSKAEAIALLQDADKAFDESMHYESLGKREQAIRSLVKASALWTHATWKEFLETDLIRVPPPRAYRPLN